MNSSLVLRNKAMQGYMIKNTKTGEYFRKESYSSGRWSTSGDIWTVKRHVLDGAKYNGFLNPSIYGQLTIVDPFEIVLVKVVEMKAWSLSDFENNVE